LTVRSKTGIFQMKLSVSKTHGQIWSLNWSFHMVSVSSTCRQLCQWDLQHHSVFSKPCLASGSLLCWLQCSIHTISLL